MHGPTSLGHRAPLLWLLIPFGGGIAAAHFLFAAVPTAIALGITFTGLIAAASLHRKSPRISIACFVVGLTGLGSGYYELRRERQPVWDDLPDREARLEVRLLSSPPRETESRFLNFHGRITHAPNHLQDLTGQAVYLHVRRPSDVARITRGAVMQVVGQLKVVPRSIGQTGFQQYLSNTGYNFQLSRGRVEGITQPPSAYAVFRNRLKTRASRALVSGLEYYPAVQVALRAMLLGERTDMDDAQKDLFLRSGTMHLFAISGLHIGIIAAALYGALRFMRLPRLPAFALGSLSLVFYVDMIGNTPSATRAWLMVTCVHAAMIARAPGNSLSALAASALGVLLLDPSQLFSLGFQMSYGIVSALLLYGLPLGEACQQRYRLWSDLPPASLSSAQRWLQNRWSDLLMVTALACSASLIGWISGVAFFGWFTPGGLLANLTLIPLASFAIVGGFVALVSGLAGFSFLAQLFNHAAALILIMMQGALEGLLLVPGASHAMTVTHGAWGVIALLSVLGAMVWGYLKNWDQRVGWYATPVAVTTVMLVTGARFV